MSSKKPSGAFYRKRKEKEEEELRKTPRIDDFIKGVKKAKTDPVDGTSPNIEEIEKVGEEIVCEPVLMDLETPAVTDGGLRYLFDVSHWVLPLKDGERVEIVKRGSDVFQNINGPFATTIRPGSDVKGKERKMDPGWFYIKLPNEEKILRRWMVYSPITNKLYCFCCRLFNFEINISSSKFISGFDKWWKLNPKVLEHEQSDAHQENNYKWKLIEKGLASDQTIDSNLHLNLKKRTVKWRKILKRIVDVVFFLAKQNLPLRGHRENEFSDNKGNFLELINFLGNYDVTIKEHIMLKKNSVAKYLSPLIQNEIIGLLAKNLKNKLVAEIHEAKYYGMMFDTTPDISHLDQMSKVIRYVHLTPNSVEVKEVFLGFHIVRGKKAADLSKEILDELEKDGLDIMLCRGQGYDNAATMAGIHGGVQAIILKKNEKALFNGCVNHNLNLAGQHSFSQNADCVTFFGGLQAMYAFFAASTHRWDRLNAEELSVKRLSETRWSAHFAAVKAACKGYDSIIKALVSLTKSDENSETRGAAGILLDTMENFSFVSYLIFWDSVLKEVDLVQNVLQTKGISAQTVLLHLKALLLFLDKRHEIVENAISKALELATAHGFETERRVRKKRLMDGETATAVHLTWEAEIRKGMLECLDRFRVEVITRMESLQKIVDIFGFLCALFADEEDSEESAKTLARHCECSAEELLTEKIRLKNFAKAAELVSPETLTALDILKFIVQHSFLDSVPNLVLGLRLFLTVCPSVATCERSFSKLALIKTFLRSVMSQERLDGLALISIEGRDRKDIDFDEIINMFAAAKARRVDL